MGTKLDCVVEEVEGAEDMTVCGEEIRRAIDKSRQVAALGTKAKQWLCQWDSHVASPMSPPHHFFKFVVLVTPAHDLCHARLMPRLMHDLLSGLGDPPGPASFRGIISAAFPLVFSPSAISLHLSVR